MSKQKNKKYEAEDVCDDSSLNKDYIDKMEQKKKTKRLYVVPLQKVFRSTILPTRKGSVKLGERYELDPADKYLMNHVETLIKMKIVKIKEVIDG